VTDQGYVHYLIITDRSGSMAAIKQDMEGGLRTFIDVQLAGIGEAKRTVSFYQFDTVHDLLWDFAPLADAQAYELVPRGSTALLDACGQAITAVGKRLAAMAEDERPYQVTVVIITDGQENSSRTYTRAQVKELTARQQEKYNWKFTYIGANQDVFAEAQSIGIPLASALATAGSGFSYRTGWNIAAQAASASTVATNVVISYSQSDRDEAMKP
jgi:uncharacterized protein YegL